MGIWTRFKSGSIQRLDRLRWGLRLPPRLLGLRNPTIPIEDALSNDGKLGAPQDVALSNDGILGAANGVDHWNPPPDDVARLKFVGGGTDKNPDVDDAEDFALVGERELTLEGLRATPAADLLNA